MKIPKKIKIFNIEYLIEWVDEIDESDRLTDARVVFDKQKILLKKNRGEDYMRQIFLHEVIHIIYEHFELKHNEKQVNLLSKGLVEVLRELL